MTISMQFIQRTAHNIKVQSAHTKSQGSHFFEETNYKHGSKLNPTLSFEEISEEEKM